jgi:transposase-like protein
MYRIVASINSLQQHLDSLANHPIIYRPRVCPHCSFGQLWRHGCYLRKADRTGATSSSLNPIPIPRFLCRGCHQTCSRLPECIPPRRWYHWVIQQAVLLMLLTECSLRRCAKQCGPDRHTVRRWWRELQERHHEFAWLLRMRFPELGRSVDCSAFWQNCWQSMSLSQAMAWLDREGVIVP